jgi:hypothetical protein
MMPPHRDREHADARSIARAPKRWRGKWSWIAGTAAALVAIPLCAGYHGERAGVQRPIDTVRAESVIAAARDLEGILYDPLKGGLGDLGGRLGFIVCSDVPLIAYARAGVALDELLAADWRLHPERYGPSGGDNTPASPAFPRRTRNLYAWCQGTGRLVAAGAPPEPADLVFYERPAGDGVAHVAVVTHVDAGGALRVIEAAAGTVLAGERSSADVERRGWRIAGFGRILGAPSHGH